MFTAKMPKAECTKNEINRKNNNKCENVLFMFGVYILFMLMFYI